MESAEKEWEELYIVMECTNDVFGMRRVGGQRRKGSELWNEDVGGVMAEKRWLQRRDMVTYDRYLAESAWL